MERVLEPPISSEDTMKKALSLVLVLGLMLQLSSCSKKPRLDIANFEKYALEDLQIEKKDISTGDRNAYYDLDHTITIISRKRTRDRFMIRSSKQKNALPKPIRIPSNTIRMTILILC